MSRIVLWTGWMAAFVLSGKRQIEISLCGVTLPAFPLRPLR